MSYFNFKKRYGQNFLIDNNIVKKIVDSAEIDENTLVIEIGPGQGVMSKLIIPKAGFTLLYEIDNELEEYLSNLEVKGEYKLIFEDFLKVNVIEDIKDFNYEKFYVVANLPYYITTPIISKFILDRVFPDKMVVMVQKEVADRFVADVGTHYYGSFTVLLNYYYYIHKLFDVSKNSFIPKPNVDSSVVILSINNNRKFLKDESFFVKIVRDSFQFKRKNIKNNLKKYDLLKIENVLKKYGLSLNDRAEDFILDVFIDISNILCD